MASTEWLIDSRYRITKCIGTGSFGMLWTNLTLTTFLTILQALHTYAGYDVFSGEKVALKLEPRSSSYFHLENESTIYCYLGPKCTGIPQLRWSGIDHDYSVLVLSLLGPSLESLLSNSGHCFTLPVVATIAEQLVSESFQFIAIYWVSCIYFLPWEDPHTSYYSQRLEAWQYLDLTRLAHVYHPCHWLELLDLHP